MDAGQGLLQRLKSDPPLAVAAFGVLLCVIAQIMIWTKVESDRETTQTLMLLLSGVCNVLARSWQNRWMHCISAVVVIVLFDLIVCYTDSTMWQDDPSDAERTLRAALILLMIGTLLSFAAVPVSGCKPPISKAGLGFWLAFLALVGCILIVAAPSAGDKAKTGGRSGICGYGGTLRSKRYTSDTDSVWEGLARKTDPSGTASREAHELADDACPNNGDNTKCYYTYYPVHVARGMYIAFFYMVSGLIGFTEGTSLAAVLCMITLHDYQPAGPGGAGRLSEDFKTGQAGLYLTVIGMLFVVIHYVVCILPGRLRPDPGKLLGDTKGKWLIACFVFSLAGGILIWAAERPNDAGHWAHGQEAWDVTVALVSTLLMALAYSSGSTSLPAAALGLSCGIANRIVGPANSQVTTGQYLGGCPAQYATSGFAANPEGIMSMHGASFPGTRTQSYFPEGLSALRIGYILLLVGWLGSFSALPGASPESIKGAATRLEVRAGAVIIACVAYLWCGAQSYWGQLGLTACAAMACLSASYEEGSLVVFTSALVMLPALTPCTMAGCVQTNGATAMLLLVCALCLAIIVVHHTRTAKPPPAAAGASGGDGGAGLGGGETEPQQAYSAMGEGDPITYATAPPEGHAGDTATPVL
eukprot:TRINITY_DN70399_c0_g1_i1.p1 TRINITY_DN70399_c0_g1~~TRINITY_DN70399_c0_g1_i1.p1  ORF type:complete len:643 (+),score=145.05 TRINITY_DN70399_c0_g1_i1:83-2011(+)